MLCLPLQDGKEKEKSPDKTSHTQSEEWGKEDPFGNQSLITITSLVTALGWREEAHSKSGPGSSSQPTHTFSLFQEKAVKCYKDRQPGQWEKFSQGLIAERLDTFCSENFSTVSLCKQLLLSSNALFTPYLLTSLLWGTEFNVKGVHVDLDPKQLGQYISHLTLKNILSLAYFPYLVISTKQLQF